MNERTKPVECNLAISSVVGIGDTKTIPAASTHVFLFPGVEQYESIAFLIVDLLR